MTKLTWKIKKIWDKKTKTIGVTNILKLLAKINFQNANKLGNFPCFSNFLVYSRTTFLVRKEEIIDGECKSEREERKEEGKEKKG